ncbi:MAG: T9SS type A sorting domain-containing protein [Saprospiraceae bacterium]|nr:T9SS type A sorting domain-containing protein [Saprospiraceae bacterium]
MNHIKYILPLFFFFSFGKYAVSQPDYNLRFQFVSANGSDYVVDIILSYTSAGRLGSSNLVFSYNGSDIASPVLVSHNLSANYSTPTMTSPGANLASLNIELNVDNSGIPIGVFPAETNLARVRFTVLDPNGFSNLQWNAAHPVHIVFLDNNSDILDANNLVPLNSSPLPLELLFFNTNTKDGTIHLAWKSVNETNFSGYEIQRSEDDGRHFTKIGWQPSLGGSWEQPYSLKDTDVRAGVNYYYRLRQIDLDGRYVYSHLVSAELPSDAPQLSISPNPNDGRFWVELSDISEEEITACLIDAQGQKVWSALKSGGRWKIGSERALPSGVYILQISNRRQLWVEKVVVR